MATSEIFQEVIRKYQELYFDFATFCAKSKLSLESKTVQGKKYRGA